MNLKNYIIRLFQQKYIVFLEAWKQKKLWTTVQMYKHPAWQPRRTLIETQALCYKGG